MTDREKLIKLIDKARYGAAEMCHEQGCVGCSYWNDRPHCRNGFIADHLLSDGVTFATDTNDGGKWISVEDRLPSCWFVTDLDTDYREPETYIVFVKGEELATTAYYLDGKFIPPCDGFVSGVKCNCLGFADEITHWMPMPTPPLDTTNQAADL